MELVGCGYLLEWKERNVLFNDALNTFYLRRWTYGKGPFSHFNTAVVLLRCRTKDEPRPVSVPRQQDKMERNVIVVYWFFYYFVFVCLFLFLFCFCVCVFVCVLFIYLFILFFIFLGGCCFLCFLVVVVFCVCFRCLFVLLFFALTMQSTHFIYACMVKNHSHSERGNALPVLHVLLFTISSKGSFVCTIQHTGQHIPRPLVHKTVEHLMKR